MNIHCLECGKEFIPSKFNTKIIGPYVEVNCPFCSDVFKGKLLVYVTKQIGGWRSHSTSDAAKMQALAQLIELNSSEYYEKKGMRHGKKKVRNV
jgi:DNA-directed RNA polymerase subunit RPC12/RpoP